MLPVGTGQEGPGAAAFWEGHQASLCLCLWGARVAAGTEGGLRPSSRYRVLTAEHHLVDRRRGKARRGDHAG